MHTAKSRDEKVERPAAGFDPEPWRAELDAFVRRLGARDAEDVVQETFLRAVERPPKTHPRAWLYRIALNVVRDRGREERRAEAALPHLAPVRAAAPDPAARAEARNLAERAAGIVERLPEKQRLSILLRVQRHMDYDEVAIALDCSVATARQHFHLAVKAVRNELSEDARD